MALIGDTGGGASSGRSGPYWRRRLGTTLPGEFTNDQLNRVNMIRRAQGLPPVGGAQGFDTPAEGAGPGGNPAGAPAAAGPPPIHPLAQRLMDQLNAEHGINPGGMMRQAQGAGNVQQALQSVEGDVGMSPVDPGFLHQRGGNVQGSVANLRDLLLRRLTGAAPQLTSSAALHHVIGRYGGRRGGHQNILPQRRGLPAAGRQLPY